ncbi:OmpA family protein [Ketobacter sp. MCCC 1A13808]|uniref:OmpA family protein n=1 Tax=Ketobacter sp. MCCC 1A13808 TaxID=2602738 RepID=UPI000F17FB2E|nr:OmpA family protein [Ketobacter sp. MCCC 1A13808]MVF14937.1 OmpA family protein [Ketobacter sp. MCCC 1A13808]RLP55942.1 MAG: glycine zipper 2TM domain-containing protein [Ketobacter sp.]
MKLLGSVALSGILLVASGCTIDPYTGEKKVSNSAIGAAAGAVVGAAVSSKDDRAKGAAIGAAVGGGAGYYFDYQEKILRQKLEGTGVSVTRTESGIRLNMPGNVSFPSDQYDLKPSFYEVLDSVAVVLKEYNKTSIQVVGHTDSTGSFEHNQALSENRANSVKSYLEQKGVAANRLHSNGYGPRQPVASNDTAQGRAANRRVEIQILGQS